MMEERNCQFCKYYEDGYCKNLELKPCYPQKGCDDFSKRNELKKDTMQVLKAYISPNGVGFPDVKDAIKDLIEWSKNEYKRGWEDALSKALKEAYTIHSEEGSFQVVQVETLIGLGYAIDDSQVESEEHIEISNEQIEQMIKKAVDERVKIWFGELQNKYFIRDAIKEAVAVEVYKRVDESKIDIPKLASSLASKELAEKITDNIGYNIASIFAEKYGD